MDIKLNQDYCHQSKSEDRLQDIVQVVGKNRFEVPALRKKSLKNIR